MNNYTTNFQRLSPAILSLLGTVGVVVTAVTAVKATPKALAQLEEKKIELKDEELSVKETVVAVWKCYVPTAAIAFSTIACILGASLLGKHQQAALTSAYALLSNSYNTYKSKLRELYGEEAHQTIMDSIVKSKCSEVRISTPGLMAVDTLDFCPEMESEIVRTFYDVFSDRYFESTIDKVLQAEYHLNRNFALGSSVTVNDFYDFLGLDAIDAGDKIGWSGLSDIYWIDFNHYCITLDDGMEILVIEMVFEPSTDEINDE